MSVPVWLSVENSDRGVHKSLADSMITCTVPKNKKVRDYMPFLLLVNSSSVQRATPNTYYMLLLGRTYFDVSFIERHSRESKTTAC